MNILCVSVPTGEAEEFLRYSKKLAEKCVGMFPKQKWEFLLGFREEFQVFPTVTKAAKIRATHGQVMLSGLGVPQVSENLQLESPQNELLERLAISGVTTMMAIWALQCGLVNFTWEGLNEAALVRTCRGSENLMVATTPNEMSIHTDMASSEPVPDGIDLLRLAGDGNRPKYTGLIAPQTELLSASTRAVLTTHKFYFSQWGPDKRTRVMRLLDTSGYEHCVGGSLLGVDEQAEEALDKYWSMLRQSPRAEVLLAKGDLLSFDNKLFPHYRRVEACGSEAETLNDARKTRIDRRLLLKTYGLRQQALGRWEMAGLLDPKTGKGRNASFLAPRRDQINPLAFI